MVIHIFCQFTSFTFFIPTNWGISKKSVLEVWKFHLNKNLCKAHTIAMKSNIFNKRFHILTYSCIYKYRFVYNYEALYYAQYTFFQWIPLFHLIISLLLTLIETDQNSNWFQTDKKNIRTLRFQNSVCQSINFQMSYV